MFNKSNSLSSTNLPDTFWLTSFGGMGEKPGATTNDYCKTGTFGEGENAVGRSPASAFEGKGATEGASSEKVETKDETTKFGLHYIWLAALAIRAKTGGKPMPETARANAWDCKLDENVAGTPPAMLELASTLHSHDHQGQKGRGLHIHLPASLRQRTIRMAAGRAKDFSVGTRRRRKLVRMTWQRSGVQTGCKVIVGGT